MDMFGVIMLTLILIWVILFATGLISLEKRDKNKKILEDKWALWGTIAFVLAILGFLVACIFGYVIWFMAMASD